MPAKNESNEIKITRLYDAPVKLVWDAWTDPKKVAKWWGPRGFTITTHSKDLKVGGHWSYTMHGPDGTNYENKTIYHEVEKYSRLVYDHGGNDDRPPLFRVTVTFTEVRGKTKMDMTMALETPEAAKNMKVFIKNAGGNATWDRLAEYLSDEGSGVDKFVINRSFEAPSDVVFKLWTDPDQLSKWLPPSGFTMKMIKANLKKDGTTFYSMSDGKETTFFGKNNYLEITPSKRIVYTQQFCDSNEKVIQHFPNWPLTMLVTVDFYEENENETRITLTTEISGEATAQERETFKTSKPGMTLGWSASFNKASELC
jgi:uncharacterized protein YndB with AHSA1/START domain